MDHVSIVIILFTNYLEAAHVVAVVTCWSFVIVWTFGPMPFYLGQLVTTVLWSTADIMCMLGFSISLFKILLVTHFDLIFNKNPETLGRKLLGLSLLAGSVPNCLICFVMSTKGAAVAPAAAYFTGEQTTYASVSAMQLYGTFWFLACVAMLTIALVCIPYYGKRRQPPAILAAESHEGAGKSVSLAKVLLGSFGLTLVIINNFIAQIYGLSGFVNQTLLGALLICLQFIFFILDYNIKRYVRKKLWDKLQAWHLIFCCNYCPGLRHPRINPSSSNSIA